MRCGGCTCLSHRSAGVGLLETSETRAILKKWFDYLPFGFIILAPQEKELLSTRSVLPNKPWSTPPKPVLLHEICIELKRVMIVLFPGYGSVTTTSLFLG